MTTEVPLRTLSPNQPFRLPPPCAGEYRLVYANQCRALVEPLARRRHAVTTRDGETVEFDAPGGRQNWAPDTFVEPIEGSTISLNGGATIGLDQVPILMALKREAQIGRPAQKPARQCDPATKRGRMLKILVDSVTGETPITELMREFSFTRSAVLTYCNEMHRDYGMGYAVVGESIRINFLTNVQPFKQGDSDEDRISGEGQKDISNHRGGGPRAKEAPKVKERQVAAPRHDGGKPKDRPEIRRPASGGRLERVHRRGVTKPKGPGTRGHSKGGSK